MSYGNVRTIFGHSTFHYRKNVVTGLPYFFAPICSKCMLLEGTGFVSAAIPQVTFVTCFCQRTEGVQILS